MKNLTVILFLLLVISVAFNAVLLIKPSDLGAFLPNNDNENIKKYISSVIHVDAGDDPTIAEVRDVEALRKQDAALYETVENGDKILIYNQVIIIYRPSIQKIVQAVRIPATE